MKKTPKKPGVIPGKQLITTPLLAERRRRYGIPRLPQFLGWDRVAIFQINTNDGEADKFKDSRLYKAETTQNRERLTAPRGVICGMGMGAYDLLRGQGIELGQIVWFQRMSVWQQQVDIGQGRHAGFVMVTAGEITGSEDVLQAIETGKLHFEYDNAGRLCIHDGDKPRARPDRPSTYDL